MKELAASDEIDRMPAPTLHLLGNYLQGAGTDDLAPSPHVTVADVARKAQCATIVVLSKWDITELRIEVVRQLVAARLRQRPPVIAVSAFTGRGLERLLETVEERPKAKVTTTRRTKATARS